MTLNKSFLQRILLGLWLLSLTGLLFAGAGGGKDLGGIAEGVTEQLGNVATLFVVVAYVAGVGFALMGITQFKAHKDSPQQVPISKPIVYIMISAGLLFLPTLMDTAGQTVFGGDQQSGFGFEPEN